MKRTGLPLIENRVKRMRLGDQDGDRNRHQETPLDPIKSDWQIFRGPPAYTHVSLPAILEYQHTSTNTFVQRDHVVRLTSPYQPFRGINETDLNTGTGVALYGVTAPTGQWESSSGTAFEAQWYRMYADLYKYYSVLACRYRISFENFTGDKIWVHIMKYNKTEPPRDVSNHDMLLWSGVKSYLSTPHAAWFNQQQLKSGEANQDNMEDDDHAGSSTNMDQFTNWGVSRQNNTAVIKHSDTYEAGSTQQEIILDEQVSTWTAVTANPLLEENLLIRIKNYDNATFAGVPNTKNYGRILNYNIKIEVEYLCEFRELQEGFRYPVRRNPIRINTENDKLKNTQ